mmetsp:Transcript_107105/g.297859  ORF Transcript_107105/g.297859 Transcript_107105/m.297859 type:complete len:97 (-) Transcript_107105:549-839(-)
MFMLRHLRHCSGNGLNNGSQDSWRSASKTSAMDATVVWKWQQLVEHRGTIHRRKMRRSVAQRALHPVGLGAFPSVKFDGDVSSIARIGFQAVPSRS